MAGFVHSSTTSEVVLIFTLIVVVIQVSLTAYQTIFRWSDLLPRTTLMLVGPVMALSWAASSLFVWGLTDLDILASFAVGGALAPTDPVLVSSAVHGKLAQCDVPLRVRNVMLVESAINDGFAAPFVFLTVVLHNLQVHLPQEENLVGEFFKRWLGVVLLYEVVLSVLIFLALGYFSTHFLNLAIKKKWLEKPAQLSWALILALVTVGTAHLLGMNAILATFAASYGSSVSESDSVRRGESDSEESVDYVSATIFFVVLGTLFPFGVIGRVAIWRWIVLFLLILFFRRLPFVMLFWSINALPHIHTWGEALFLAWNAPIGIAATFYALLLVHDTSFPPEAPAAIFVMILGSIIVHGLLSAPSMLLLKDRMDWEKGSPENEKKEKKVGEKK